MEEQAPGLQPVQFPVSVPLWGFVFVVDLFVFLFVGPVCLSVLLSVKRNLRMLCAELNRPLDKEKRMPIEKWTRNFSRSVRGEGGL